LLAARLLRGRFVFMHSRQHLPLVGFLNSASADGYASMASAFRQGLKETGYVAGLRTAHEMAIGRSRHRLRATMRVPFQFELPVRAEQRGGAA